MIIVLIIALILIFISVTLFSLVGIRLFSLQFKTYRDKFLKEVKGDLDELFSTIQAGQVFYLNIVSIIGMGILGLILFRNIIIAIIFAGVGVILPKLGLKITQKRRLEKFNNQLVDGITLVSNSLRSGFTLPQGIDLLIKEMSSPISDEFGFMYRKVQLGTSLEDSLRDMSERLKSKELDMVIRAILISKETGGNLAEVFQQIATTIRERNKMQGKIKALTAQGKMQGIVVGLLPIVLGLALHYINPQLMAPMFHTPLGWMFIVVIIIMEIIGVVLIRKIVAIEI